MLKNSYTFTKAMSIPSLVSPHVAKSNDVLFEENICNTYAKYAIYM